MTLVDPAWERVVAEQPDLADDVRPRAAGQAARARPARCCRATTGWRIRPGSTRRAASSASRSSSSDGTLLRGFVDRIDVAPTGEVRVVDYKTGKAPPEARALAEAKAMFQMKFYAVALLRSRGVLPARLRLLYLADGQVLDYTPDLDELLRFEKTLMAIWRAIQSAGATGDFRPQAVPAVRLVRPSRALPGVRRHAAALPGLAAGPDGARSVIDRHLPPAARRRRVPGVRVDRWARASNWDRDPARVSAAGADDQGRSRNWRPASGLRVGRLTLDILGAIPVAPGAGAGVGGAARRRASR